MEEAIQALYEVRARLADKWAEAVERVAAARQVSSIRWTIDDFDHLICSGGFELEDGALVPRF